MGGNSNQMVQEGLGGAQIASGAVATFMGAPEVGVPMMLGGIKSETNPNANQGPVQSGISGLMSAGGAAMGGMGSGASTVGADSAGNLTGPLNLSPAQSNMMNTGSSSGLGNFNPAMLSQLIGGANQGMQQPKPPTPQTTQPPMSPRPPMNMQNAGQRAATPMAQPAPQVPKPPQGAGQPSIQQMFQKLLGGSM